MGIGAKPGAVLQFPAKIGQVVNTQAPLEEGPSIHAGSGMPLKVYKIARVIRTAPAEKVIKTYFVKRCGGSKGGDMPAEPLGLPVGTHNHGHCIPARDIFNEALHVPVPGVWRLLAVGNRINVGCVGRKGQADIPAVGMLGKCMQDGFDAAFPGSFQDFIQGFEPFPCLDIIMLFLLITHQACPDFTVSKL